MFQIKKIDELLIKGFLPPFVMTFFIALFVLIMQFLWKYIDDIIGKGVDIMVIVELLFYLSVSLFPMALPIAVLISSVMVMGNSAEQYELASMKSAGIPLLRIMRPLIILSTIIMVLSFFISNNFIPISNLKFQSRLYDIKKQKPTLSLEEGIFNYDFKGFAIRVDKKHEKAERELEGMMIYDHSGGRGTNNSILANEGRMYMANEGDYMVMKLYEGTQYQDVDNLSRSEDFPFIRVEFKEWQKVFDMSEFDLKRTEEDLFKKHHRMLSVGELITQIDTIEMKRLTNEKSLQRKVLPYFYFLKMTDSLVVIDTLHTRYFTDTTVESIVDLVPMNRRTAAFQKASSMAKRVRDYAKSVKRSSARSKYSVVEHYNEIHRKGIFAVACFIFLFIGAPMGAIVRKGGFGWPILIAIVFFMLFMTFVLIGERLAQNFVVPHYIGMWLPCLVLMPIGVFLTNRAMNDSKMLNMETYARFFKNLIGFFKSKDTEDAEETQ